MELIALFKVLKRKWWLILLVPAISVIAAYFFTQSIQDVYTSTAQLSTGFTQTNKIQLDKENLNFRDIEIKFNNLIQNLKSNKVLSLLSYRLIVHDLSNPTPFRASPPEGPIRISSSLKPAIIAEFMNKLDSMKVLSKFNKNDAQLEAILNAYQYDTKSLAKSLKITRISYTDYIQIEGSSENSYLSAFMVNTLCDEFIRYNKELTFNQANESITFLEKLLKEKKKQLDVKRAELDSYKTNNSVVDITTESQSRVAQINNYELAKSEEQRKLMATTLSLRNVNDRINSIKNSGSSQDNSELITLRNKITDLNARYMNSGMNNSKLLDSLNSLRQQYATERNRVNNVTGGDTKQTITDLTNKKFELQTDLEISQSNLADIERKLEALKSTASSFANTESQIAQIQNDVDVMSTEFSSLQAKLNDAKNSVVLSGNSIKQVLTGQPTDQPEPSKKIILIGLAGFASFIFIVVLIVGMEFLDQSIQTSEKFVQITKLPLAGTLNEIKINGYELLPVFSSNVKNIDFDSFKQNLRKIRFEIEKKQKNIILVTSTTEGCGKTFVILSLAYSLSLINKRILIIDTNFKNTDLTKLLLKGSPNEKSVIMTSKNPSRLLSANFPDEEEHDSFHQFISKTVFKRVDIIGSNQGENSPSEIFAGKRFDMFLDRFSNEYDYIFLEGAALNDYPDTKELVNFSNGVIPVFSSNAVINQLDKESITFLKNLNGKLIGAVLNKVDLKKMR